MSYPDVNVCVHHGPVHSLHASQRWKKQNNRSLTAGRERDNNWYAPSLGVHSWCPRRLHSNHCRCRRWQKSFDLESRCRECDPSPAENHRAAGWCPDRRKSRRWAPAADTDKEKKLSYMNGTWKNKRRRKKELMTMTQKCHIKHEKPWQEMYYMGGVGGNKNTSGGEADSEKKTLKRA